MKNALLLLVALLCGVGTALWYRSAPDSRTVDASPGDVASPRAPAPILPPAAKAASQAMDAKWIPPAEFFEDPYEQSRQIEQAHAARREGGEWALKSNQALTAFFVRATTTLSAHPETAIHVPELKRVDCREGSCVVEAVFKGRHAAVAFKEYYDVPELASRFLPDFDFECPMTQFSAPRIPGGTMNSPTSALFHFDCESATNSEREVALRGRSAGPTAIPDRAAP